MGVDDANHAALLLPSDSRCETTAALEPPPTRSSTNAPDRDQRLGLRRESRRRRERRQPADTPGAARQFCNRVAQGGGIAALQAVGDDDDRGAACVAAEPRHGQKRLQRVADAGAAVPVADEMGGGVQRLLATLDPQRAGHAREARAEGEDLDIARRLRKRMRKRHVLLGARFHRTGYVDQQQQSCVAARAPSQPAQPAGTSPSLRTLSRRCGAGRRTDRAARAAPVTAPPRQATAASRDSRRSASPVAAALEAALDQGLGARRRQAEFVDLVGEQRLVLAACVFLQAEISSSRRPPSIASLPRKWRSNSRS